MNVAPNTHQGWVATWTVFIARLTAWRLRAVPSPGRILQAWMRAKVGAARQSLASCCKERSTTAAQSCKTQFAVKMFS